MSDDATNNCEVIEKLNNIEKAVLSIRAIGSPRIISYTSAILWDIAILRKETSLIIGQRDDAWGELNNIPHLEYLIYGTKWPWLIRIADVMRRCAKKLRGKL